VTVSQTPTTYYLPLSPPKIEKVDVTVKVITPDITNKMNADVATGNKMPYVYFGFSESDYLKYAIWQETVLSYIIQQNAIIDYYKDILNKNNINLDEPKEGEK